jgi:hypothetical protein
MTPSVAHPGGFTKRRLLRLAGISVRFHRWPAQTGEHFDEDPHQHRWWILSMPFGRFIDTRWHETSDGELHDVYQATGYADDPTVDHYEHNLTHQRRARLSIRRQYVRHPFLPYVCRADDIHSYRPTGPGSHASLVVTGPARLPTGRVWKSVPPKHG